MKFSTPILLLVFNRPKHTAQVLEVLAKLEPRQLYVVADGPRNADEKVKCDETRALINNISWDCEINSLFRDVNFGCAKSVGEGITWFFDNVEEGIILEDDCIPDLTFFEFCQELLHRFRHDQTIFHISGNNFQYGKIRGKADYYFSIFNHVWGWATWKRAWDKYDPSMPLLPSNEIDCFVADKNISDFFNPVFVKTSNGLIDTWDFRWTYTCWIHKGISILPNQNLVSNIGFGKESTHTNQVDSIQSNLTKVSLTFPLTHPSKISVNKKADLFSFRKIFQAKKTLRHQLGDLKRRILP